MTTIDTITLPSGPATLTTTGLTGADGTALAVFIWPALGRPHIPQATPDGPVLALADGIRVPQGVDPNAVRAALEDRVAFTATGDPDRRVIAEPGDPVPADDGWRIPLTAVLEDRRLYDLALRGPAAWQPVAPHSVYFKRAWDDFGLAHVSDLHVARRIDGFSAALARAGHPEAAETMLNINDQFRHFVRYANRLHAEGHLDVIVATGDLVDYLYERDDDRRGLGNAGFLRDLVLGRSGSHTVPVVEELRVPILMTPGNHDYRRNHYHLVFDVNVGSLDLTRVRNFSNLGITEKQAMALGNALYFPGRDEVPNLGKDRAIAMIEIDDEMSAFREAICEIGPHVAQFGPHRLVLIDSAHEVGIPGSTASGLWELIKQWWGSGSEDTTTLIGGSPNCEGVSDDEYALAVEALEGAPPQGLVIAALHAPLVNLAGGEMPYFLRETMRPSQAEQARLWLARRSGGHADVTARHPQWFAGEGAGEPAFLSRGSSADLLDYGVSRGRTDDLLAAFAGIGTSRWADLILAGHTHRMNEVSIRAEGGEPVFYLDHYTSNPRAGYPNSVVTGHSPLPGGDGRLDLPVQKSFVEVTEDALPGARPWPMPYAARHPDVVHVPPYADPLDRATDPRAWWDRHKPLQLQTGALGLWENPEVSFSGFRLVRVRDDVIERVDFVSRVALDESGWNASLEELTAPPPPRTHRLLPRSERVAHPPSGGGVATLVGADGVAASVVYPAGTGALIELWDTGADGGGGVLAGADRTHAVGRPAGYLDAGGGRVIVFRNSDGEVESAYWHGPSAVGHDRLSRSCAAPRAVGDPMGYVHYGMTHVFYRSDGGHIEELTWTDDAVTHTRISGYCGEPTAAGDPFGYSAGDTNIVLYRGDDRGIHSLYWSVGATGHDGLSGTAGGPPADGDPVGMYLPDLDAHNVLYRGTDGSLQLIWWADGSAAQGFSLTASAGSPAAAADGTFWRCPQAGTLHVVYPDALGRLHEIAWAPGGPQTWTDLSRAALAPPSRVARPSGFCAPGSTTKRLAYVATDGHVHEIRWG